ncbi:guanylyl cyclase 1 [Zea mays]|uniref:Guanylyl cyclase 1 n=1 Tax=Zea mays TaxID=4577 RepID=A0A1D6PJQ3_MAIZE|nr:guanylyl cyclase 1 [Zea mays]
MNIFQGMHQTTLMLKQLDLHMISQMVYILCVSSIKEPLISTWLPQLQCVGHTVIIIEEMGTRAYQEQVATHIFWCSQQTSALSQETCNTQQEQIQTFQKQLAVATEKLKDLQSLAKFMFKATGNAVNLVQIVGMKVPHVQQAFTWDYGLACVLMVLRTLGIDCCDDIADLERLCRTTSIWTVDLAYLLNKISVSFPFCTVTLGANPQYSAESFCREQLQEDIDRVDELFGKALDAGISIQATQPLEGCQYVGIHSIRIVCAFFWVSSKH